MLSIRLFKHYLSKQFLPKAYENSYMYISAMTSQNNVIAISYTRLHCHEIQNNQQMLLNLRSPFKHKCSCNNV